MTTETMPSATTNMDKILGVLKVAGWLQKNIITAPTVRLQDRIVRPDIILLYNQCPIALILTFPAGSSLNMPEQALDLRSSLNLPFSFITNNEKFWEVLPQGDSEQLPQFPSPESLANKLKNEWGENDPRLFSLPNLPNVQIEQALAVTRLLEACIKGELHLTVKLGSQTLRTQVLTFAVLKLLNSGFRNSCLIVGTTEMATMQLRKSFQEIAPTYQSQYVQTLTSESELKSLLILTPNTRSLAGNLKRGTLPQKAFNLIIVEDGANLDLLNALAGFYPNATIVALTGNFTQPDFGRLAFSYGVEDQIAVQSVRPPDGYNSLPLKDIVEIKSGLVEVRDKQTIATKNGKPVLLLAGRDIDEKGQIDFTKLDKLQVEVSELEEYRLLPGDILVASWVSPEGSTKVSLIPLEIVNLPQSVIFVSRLSRLRITNQKVKPQQVALFLSSDIGQNLLKQFAGKTKISAQDLSQVPIFVEQKTETSQSPETQAEPAKAVTPNPDFGKAADAKRRIQDEVLGLLEEVTNSEKDKEPKQTEELLQEAAQRLQNITFTIIGRKALESRVIEDYPTPIALSYRRFREARFNLYEQVSRLRDVYEATSFFVYNVVLADRCSRLNYQAYTAITNKFGRIAYKDSAVAARLTFIEKVCEIAKTQGDKLFLAELPDSDFSVKADKLRELRNNLSHTATQTESQIRNILEENKPLLNDLLESVSFLVNYQLVRIPGFYSDGKKIIRQMELYRGTAPSYEEDSEFEEDLTRLKSHRYHLVLLDQDDNMLDLHPLYQLIASEDTRHVQHLCFIKSVKTPEGQSTTIMKVESVQEGFEFVTLEGLADLSTMTSGF